MERPAERPCLGKTNKQRPHKKKTKKCAPNKSARKKVTGIMRNMGRRGAAGCLFRLPRASWPVQEDFEQDSGGGARDQRTTRPGRQGRQGTRGVSVNGGARRGRRYPLARFTLRVPIAARLVCPPPFAKNSQAVGLTRFMGGIRDEFLCQRRPSCFVCLPSRLHGGSSGVHALSRCSQPTCFSARIKHKIEQRPH